MRKAVYLLLFCLAFSSACASPVLETREKAWPEYRKCEDCIETQVGFAIFQFPRKSVRKINVLNLPNASVNILYAARNSETNKEIGILVHDEDRATGGMKKKGLYNKLSVANVQEFFYALGRSQTTAELTIAREVMSITEKSKYIVYRGKSASAFLIRNSALNQDILYIVPNVTKKLETNVYMIAGELDDSLINTLLASFRLAY